MLKIKEAIIVEGRYDKNKLSQIVDATIIETSGFRVFKDREKRMLLKRICEEKGVVVLTDSDGAGFLIRNHLRGFLPQDKVKHAYIPQINGKEKRKANASKEGFLGVEGIDDELIVKSLLRAGVTILDGESAMCDSRLITKTDFYEDGLSGASYSARLRGLILKECNLPTYMTSNAMIEAFNVLFTFEEYKELVKRIKTTCKF